MWENKRKEKARAGVVASEEELNRTAFMDLTDKQNPNFVYVY